jgi:hypothetical protein
MELTQRTHLHKTELRMRCHPDAMGWMVMSVVDKTLTNAAMWGPMLRLHATQETGEWHTVPIRFIQCVLIHSVSVFPAEVHAAIPSIPRDQLTFQVLCVPPAWLCVQWHQAWWRLVQAQRAVPKCYCRRRDGGEHCVGRSCSSIVARVYNELPLELACIVFQFVVHQ